MCISQVTDQVIAKYNALSDLRLEEGDLFAASCKGVDGKNYLLASFHGDTNGLASTPAVRALMEYRYMFSSPRFALDWIH